MSAVHTLIGNVKGPQGAQGETGQTGATGAAATITVGTTTTTTYGNSASVTNSGTTSAAVLDFVIPQGAPGESVTDASDLTVDELTASTASYPTYSVGETVKVILGKIAKYLSDLKDSYVSKSMMTTSTNISTENTNVADAKVIKTLNDSITALSPTIVKHVSGITSSSTGTLVQLNIVPSTSGMNYLVIGAANTASDAGSIYFVRVGADSSISATPVFEGTHAQAPRISSSGVVTKNNSTSTTGIGWTVIGLF